MFYPPNKRKKRTTMTLEEYFKGRRLRLEEELKKAQTRIEDAKKNHLS